MAEGGVTSQGNVESIIDKLGPEQLQQARENALNRRDLDTVDAIDERLAELAQSKSMYAGLGGAFDQIPAEQQEAMMAGGGIVAFANGGSYLDQAEKSRAEQLAYIDQATTMPTPEDRRKDIVAQRDMIKGLYEPSVLPKYLEETKAERANLGKNMDEARGLGALLAAAEMIGARNFREGAKASTKAFVGEVSRVAKENKEADRLLRQSEIQLATASELYNNGMTDKAIAEADKGRSAKARAAELKAGVAGDTSKMYSQLLNTQLGKDATIAAANISAKAHRDTANKPGQLERMVSDYEQRLGRKLTADEYVQATEKMGAASYGAKYTGPDKSLEQATGIQKLVKDDPRVGAVELELLMAKGDPVKTAQLEQKLATITAEVQQEVINRAKNIKDKSGAPADASRVGRTPDAEAVNMLKSNPSTQNRKYFDDVFGAGAAAKVLGR
jgi:predicted transcriptional regulator